jgi:predicted transposase YdaD
MTLAQQLRQEGRQEGLHEGLQKAILDNLRFRLGEVPQGLAEAVGTIHNDDHLSRLQRASLEASSIEEFSSAL